MEQMRFCPRCGAVRLADAAFCGRCGSSFSTGAASAATAEVQPPADITSTRVPAEAPVGAGGAGEAAGIVGAPSPAAPLRGAERNATRRTVVVVFTIVAMTVALVGVGYWGYSNSQDLSRTRDELAATRSSLASEQGARAVAEGQARLLRTQVDTLTSQNDTMTSRNARLTSQVSAQGACIPALNADYAELQRIGDLQNANFNRTAKGSAWAKANDARQKAMNAAIDDYYEAYSAAFDGRYSAANTWITRGNAQMTKAGRLVKTMNAEIAKVDKSTKEIEQASGARRAAGPDRRGLRVRLGARGRARGGSGRTSIERTGSAARCAPV